MSIVLSIAVPLVLVVIVDKGSRWLIKPWAARHALDLRDVGERSVARDDRPNAA